MRRWRLGNGRGAEVRRKKAALGRVCTSCETTDADAYWSCRKGLCATCHERGRLNGFCRVCRAARFAERHAAIPRCRCLHAVRSAAVVRIDRDGISHLDALSLSRLWDTIRWRDEHEATGDLFASWLGRNVRLLNPDRFERLGRALRRLDSGFVVERGGHMLVVRWTGRLVAELERLSVDLALAGASPSTP
jgi:hypothetical protein